MIIGYDGAIIMTDRLDERKVGKGESFAVINRDADGLFSIRNPFERKRVGWKMEYDTL